MPELPEMERYREALAQHFVGKQITGVEINREKSINFPTAVFVKEVQGTTVTSIQRRAKHLLISLSSGKYLLLHLMLGGWLYIGSDADSPERTKQVILSFGEKKLFFIGLRLGYLHLVQEDERNQKFDELGPEPFDPALHFEDFKNRLQTRKKAIKTILVDQTFIAGIGNCYSDEICFAAKVRTTKKAAELGEDQIRALFAAIQPVLTSALQYGGYMDHPIFGGDKLTGGYNDHLLVYDREHLPCRRCGSSIIKLEIISRKSFICPNCQV